MGLCPCFPKGQQKRLTKQWEAFQPNVTDLDRVDPLVAAYERCDAPTLAN